MDVNDGDKPRSGVLLVDMKYSVIEDVLKQINDSSEGIYYYLISRNGEIIYHPRRAEMDRGLLTKRVSEQPNTKMERIPSMRMAIGKALLSEVLHIPDGNLSVLCRRVCRLQASIDSVTMYLRRSQFF